MARMAHHLDLGSQAERIFVGLADSRLRSQHGTPVPLLQIKDVRDGSLPAAEQLDSRRVTARADAQRYELRERDVVVTCRGTRLRAAIVTDATAGAVISANLMAVRLREHLLPEVLLAFLRTPEAALALQATSHGALSMNLVDLARLRVPVPPIDVQRRIAELVQAADQHHRAAIEAADLRRAVAQGAIARVFREASGAR